jgi:hypothetical protein
MLSAVLQEFVTQASGQLVGLYAELIGAVLPNISHPNRDIQVSQSRRHRVVLHQRQSLAAVPVSLPVNTCCQHSLWTGRCM